MGAPPDPGVAGVRRGGEVRIARIAGIDIRLHWTWAVAAVLYALLLAGNVFPSEVGGLSSGTYLLMGVVTALLEWLGWTNLLLLAFNLLPAFPLDGGRLLRAALWQSTGSRLKATRTAARASQALSAGLIALGVAAALLGAVGALWLVLVGLFVMSGAAAELAATEAQWRSPAGSSRI